MNREIKFKAWDEGNKIMHNNFQFINSGNEGNDWVCFISDKQDCDRTNGLLLNNPYFAQQLKVMQCIGKEDCKANMIYEGDILKTDSGANMFVTYREDMTQFVCRFTTGASMNIEKSWEIIGNIYQNPELLETVQK